jgi:hypothetical protein
LAIITTLPQTQRHESTRIYNVTNSSTTILPCHINSE